MHAHGHMKLPKVSSRTNVFFFCLVGRMLEVIENGLLMQVKNLIAYAAIKLIRK